MAHGKEVFPDGWLSQTDFAKAIDCSPSSVRYAIGKGLILESDVMRKDNGRVKCVHYKRAKSHWAKNYAPAANSTSAIIEALSAAPEEMPEEFFPEGTEVAGFHLPAGVFKDVRSMSESKMLEAHFKAELLRIEYEKKIGALLSAVDVRNQLTNFGMEVRLEMQGIAAACVDDVMIADSRRDKEAAILKEVNQALRKLTEVVERDFS